MRWLLLAPAVVAFLVVGGANLQIVELRTVLLDDLRASLSVLLFGAYALGFVSATLLGLWGRVKSLGRRRPPACPIDVAQRRRPVLPAPPAVIVEGETWPRSHA